MYKMASSWKTLSAAPRGIASDGTNLYVSDGAANIEKIAADGSVSTLASGALDDSYSLLSIDSSYIYALAPNGGTLKRFSLAGSLDESFTLSISGNNLIVVGSKIYIASGGYGTISVVDIASKAITSGWVSGLNAPGGLTYFDSNLYALCSDSIKKIHINSDGSGSVASEFAEGLENGGDLTAGLTNDGVCLYAIKRVGGSVTHVRKFQLSNGALADDNFLSFNGDVRTLRFVNSYLYIGHDQSNDVFRIFIPPPFTPLYLGNATVTDTGDFFLANTIMTTNRFPQSKHELVPRAYVDSYIKSVTEYYDAILDPNDGLTGLLDRLSYVEAQLERVYQVLWAQSRDVSAIVTAHSGAVAANYTATESPNADLIANPPSEPTVLTISNFTAI